MKKAVYILFVLLLVAAFCISFAACDATPKDDGKLNIVYLGDSIAEALIGPSPVSQRDNYGYYALVGKCNEFNYYNHAVSGHKTSTGMAGDEGLLEVLQRDTENAALLKTHIQKADIVHISVLGNNALQYDLGLLLLEVADPDFEEKYAQGTTLLNALHDGGVMYRDAIRKRDIDNGDTRVEFDFPETYQNICDIVVRIRELNPTTKIIFQTVYNPVYEGTVLLYSEALNALAKITDDGRFGAEGQPIASIAQVRKVAQAILDKLNGILNEYLEEHPGEFTILDVNRVFDDVTNSDKKDDGSVNLSSDSLGASLLFNDWTHPSNFGHAIVAGATQKLLDEWGSGSENAVENYKNIRKNQISRMFAEIENFDSDAAIASISGAETFDAVTYAYFNAIKGYTPINY